MAFRAKYLSREYLSKQIATLCKALETVSTNLSLVALLGIALIPLLPNHASSTFTSTAPAAAPIEVVRAKPVLVPDAPLPPEAKLRGPVSARLQPRDPAAAPTVSSTKALTIAARLTRRRLRAPREGESGSLGKAAGPPEAKTANAPETKAPSAPDSGSLGKTASNAPPAGTPVPPADPKSDAAKAEPPVPDTWSDGEIIAALRDCLKRLAPLGAEVEIGAPVKQEQCGSPAPVLLKRLGFGANRVEFQPAPTINCAMVAGLATWIEKTLQPAAQEVLGSPVVRVRGASGYACRNRVGTTFHSDRLSEHAMANAVDIMGFVTADGRTIDVESKWGPNARDIRHMQERAAEEVAQAKKAEDEAKVAARKADREAAQAEKLAKWGKGAKQEQAKAEAARKKEEADRAREEADRKEAERVRRSLQTAELQKLGRGIDPRPAGTKVAATKTPIPATVKADAAVTEVPKVSPEMVFLRRLHKGACGTFGTVLGPDANEAHRNHFHFDLAARKHSAFCE
jgi:hypothetical protein